MFCPLCNNEKSICFSKDKKREYCKCTNCQLIFVDKKNHLSINDEIERYSLHTNRPEETGYEQFLSRIINPSLNYIDKNSTGLDFGCGPGPILDKLFLEHNIHIYNYDPHFKPANNLLNRTWDFLITTEVIEHVKKPIDFLNKIINLVKSHGVIIIMTSLYNSNIEFKSWYYKGDPTHIMFYSKETFIWISKKYNLNVEFFDKNIIILTKS